MMSVGFFHVCTKESAVRRAHFLSSGGSLSCVGLLGVTFGICVDPGASGDLIWSYCYL